MTTIKGILLMLAIFIGTVFLMNWDPFNFNPEGLDGEGGYLLALYAIPGVIAFIWLLRKNK
jgi:hypothetical protein